MASPPVSTHAFLGATIEEVRAHFASNGLCGLAAAPLLADALAARRAAVAPWPRWPCGQAGLKQREMHARWVMQWITERRVA